MTEREWLDCTDPKPMLEYLQGNASDRKSRLFACACCRSIWRMLIDERSRRAVEIAELFADRRVTDKDRQAARKAAQDRNLPYVAPLVAFRNGDFIRTAIRCAEGALNLPRDAATLQQYKITPGDQEAAFAAYTAAELAEKEIQARLVREVFNNPFRQMIVERPWLTSTVTTLAAAIYNDRAFHQMPVVADALEDAGCTNEAILNHCRQPGVHVRGCWVIDLLLGKE